MCTPLRILLTVLLSFVCTGNAAAQNSGMEVQAAYFSPYLSQSGASLGTAFEVCARTRMRGASRPQIHSIQLMPQLSYFTQKEVSKKLLVHPEIIYRLRMEDRRTFFFAAVGMGYLGSSQRQEGSLNLASGEMNYTTELLHALFTGVSTGLGVDLRSNFGLFIKATYGREWRLKLPNSAFFGASLGVHLRLQSKASTHE